MPALPLRSAAPRSALSTVALVPLRSPGVGKSRLSRALSVEQRAALAGAMLADVVAALRAAPVERIVVVAGGLAAAAAASALGVEVVTDPRDAARTTPPTRRLDAALAAAACRLGPCAASLIVAGDLPHLTGEEVASLLAVAADVVVAPTTDGGTGGLLRRPPDACATAYGPGSADRHLALGRAAGHRSRRVDLPGFAHDVDVAADLARLRQAARPPLGPRTERVVEQIGPVTEAG